MTDAPLTVLLLAIGLLFGCAFGTEDATTFRASESQEIPPLVIYDGPVDTDEPVRVYGDWLFVGNYKSARPEALSKARIALVISATRPPLEKLDGITYVELRNFEDAVDVDLAPHLAFTIFEIMGARVMNGKERVLVHCKQGVSRSIALVIGWMRCVDRLPYDAALSLILMQRPVADVNRGFERQLRALDEHTCKDDALRLKASDTYRLEL